MGLLIVIAWFLISAAIYTSLPTLPLGSMGVFGKPILRWQYSLFAMGWLGKFFAFGTFFLVGKFWAIIISVLSIIALLSTALLVAWNWNPKTKSEIIADLELKLQELKKDE